MTKAETAKEIRSLKCVDTVRTEGDGYVIKTKPNALSTYLTHKVSYTEVGDTYCGTELASPLRVALPQYYLELQAQAFYVRLVKKPQPNLPRFGITPQYHLHRYLSEWKDIYQPCYGSGTPETSDTYLLYCIETDWKKKALIAVEFLQSAIPHYGNYPHWTANFAYRLGLVGEEILENN